MTRLLLSVALVLVAQSVSAQGLIFSDGFESGNVNSFEADGARNKCVVSSGANGVTPFAGSRMAECNWNGVVAWNANNAYSTLRKNFNGGSEFLVRGRVWVSANVDAKDGAKVLRIEGSSVTAYSFIIERVASGGVKLHYEFTNGSTGAPINWGGPNLSGRWHEVEMYEGAGGGKVWVDGTQVYSRSSRLSSFSSMSLYLMSNWSSNPGWEHDAVNNVYWDGIEIYTSAGNASGCSGSMSAGTITCGGPVDPPPPPPPPPDPTSVACVVSPWGPWVASWSTSCTNGQQSGTETQTRTIVTPASNGGAACPALRETRSVSQACTAPPPTPAPKPWYCAWLPWLCR